MARCFVGVDMGTTNTRAWLVAEDRIAGRARASIGVRDAAVAGSREVVRSSVGRLVAELNERAELAGLRPECVAAAGMITSGLGLLEVPHVIAPAGARELAAGVQRFRFSEIPDLDVHLVPGVRTGAERLPLGEIGDADVMRGEETLCVGLLESGHLAPGGMLLNLGSHWKAIRIDGEGRIAASTTSLSGELLHAAQIRTVLASSVPHDRPERIDPEWASAGMAEAVRSGLSRALFCVRLLEQRTPGDDSDRLAFLVGAFVGSELERVASFREGGGGVTVAGGGPVGEFFAAALRARGIEARVLSEEDVEAGMIRGLRRVLD